MNDSWWRHEMEKKIRVNGHLCGEFTGHRWIPRTKANDVFFDLCLNKRLSKQSGGWWIEKPSRPLWRHYTDCSCANHGMYYSRIELEQ